VSEASPGGRIDVTNTVAHEAGHFLGLDHTGVEAATMHASAPPGEVSKRSLDADDIEGLCAIYPAGSPVNDACLGAPEGFYTSQRVDEMEQTAPPGDGQTDEGCGCAVTPRAPGRAALWILALGVLVMPTRRRVGAWALGVAALLAAPAPAGAYVRTQTCSPNGGPLACEAGEAPREIFWPAACVVYHINEAGSEDTDSNRAFVAIETSFQRWTLPDCSYISFINGGFTDEDRVGYNSYTGAGQNANIVVFRDADWEHESGILALTSVTYRPSTGEIVDADIELNGVDYNFTTTNNELRVIIDVANTVTHEAGHFLGLDHSQVEEATMFATAPIRETKKRSLDLDDINGLCAIYPASQAPPQQACVGGPVGFFQRPLYGPNDGPPPAEARRCSCSTPARPAALRGVGALAALAALALLGRRLSPRPLPRPRLPPGPPPPRCGGGRRGR
jgi:MYXO-CTERM domain-containing protein